MTKHRDDKSLPGAQKDAAPHAAATVEVHELTPEEVDLNYGPMARAVTVITDSNGASVTLYEDRGRFISANYRDDNHSPHLLTTYANEEGFVTFETPTVNEGSLRARDLHAVEAGEDQRSNLLSILGMTADNVVVCNNGTADEKSVYVTDNVLDQVTADKVKQFAIRHPELAAKLDVLDLKIATLNGKPVDMGELLAAPSDFRACPAGDPQTVIEKLR